MSIHLGGAAYAHDALAPYLEPIDSVRPHPTNPRNGDTDAIVESIRVNLVYRPVYAQRTTGYLLAGNHTTAALLELGAEQVPVVWLDVDDVGAARILVGDNRIPDLGSYDDALQVQILAELAATEAGLVGTGWDDDTVQALTSALARAEDTPAGIYDSPDNVPPPQWGVIVVCDSEASQEEAYGKLRGLGYEVRVVTV